MGTIQRGILPIHVKSNKSPSIAASSGADRFAFSLGAFVTAALAIIKQAKHGIATGPGIGGLCEAISKAQGLGGNSHLGKEQKGRKAAINSQDKEGRIVQPENNIGQWEGEGNRDQRA